MCEFAVCQTVSARDHVRALRPAAGGAAVRGDRPAGHASEGAVLGEACCDAFEEPGVIAAVVVREPDDVGRQLAERGVPRPGEAALRAEAQHVEPGVRLEDALDALVGVLVDHDEPERAVRLRLEIVEQGGELVGPVDRRDDEVEADVVGGLRHRRRLPSARRGLSPRVRRPRSPRRGGDDRRGGAQRARPDERRSRAGGRRRRLGRRHRRRPRGHGRRPAARGAERRARWASPARSTSASTRRAAGTSRAWTPTTSRSRAGSHASSSVSGRLRRRRWSARA